jgi:hypothetical protein
VVVDGVKGRYSKHKRRRFQIEKSGKYSFVETQFFGCTSDTNGGAMFISKSGVCASLTVCCVWNCSALNGGGLYFCVRTVVVVDSQFVTGIASIHGSSIWISIYDRTVVSWTGLSITRGSAWAGAIVVTGRSSALGPSGALALDRSNLTDNFVMEWAFAGFFSFLIHLNFEYCVIESNHGTNGLLFEKIEKTSIRCLAIRSSRCVGTSSHIGLFAISRWLGSNESITILDSVIVDNSVDYLVGSSGFILINCHFDAFDLPAECKATFVRPGYSLASPDLFVAPLCASRKPNDGIDSPTLSGRIGLVKLMTSAVCRSNPSGGYVFANLEYVGCTNSAVYVYARTVSTTVSACTFTECRAANGAGCYFHVASAIVSRSGFYKGQASNEGDSAYLLQAENKEIHWTEIAISGGSSSSYSPSLRAESNANLGLERWNLTYETAASWACAGWYA